MCHPAVCVCVGAHMMTAGYSHDLVTQATQKRAETFGALQTALDDLLRRMTECEERNASIVTSLTELDHLLQDEKAKWTVGGFGNDAASCGQEYRDCAGHQVIDCVSL